MSFLRAAVLVLCFGVMLSGVYGSGFSAQLTQSGGSAPLANGANTVTTGGGTWTTSALGGFTDGQFQTDGGYIVPVQGTYHFDALLTVEVSTPTAPDQTVDIRIVKCANGCNALCTGGSSVAATLVQSGTYIADGFTAAFPPTFTVSASFTGSFNTGDLIALCIDSDATSGAIRLLCEPNYCTFSGYST